MIKLAVFGDPIAHSLSPKIHTCFAQQTGLDIDYQAIHADADMFLQALKTFSEQGGIGANLTVPHKQTGLSVCASLSDHAQDAGAVNTLIRTDSRWHGDNTDGLGLVWDLQRLHIELEDSHILIIGAGGAARGIIPTLLEQNPARIFIANRTLDRAEHLADRFDQHPVSVCDLDEVAELESIELIINASAAGHTSNRFALPALNDSSNPFCYDLNYGTAAQLFMDWTRRNRYKSTDGLGMLVGQAAQAFQLWTGIKIDDHQQEKTLAQFQQQ